jgi:hypothetical protein
LPEFLINILTHPAFTAVIGFLAGHFFAVGRDRRREFNSAADAFRDAFTPALSAIRNPSFEETTNPIDPHDLLKEAFGKHRTAYEIFRLSLDGARRSKFDSAWINYYAYDNDSKDGSEHLLKYSPGWESKPIKECRDDAIANIEKLLEFAKHK